MKALLFSVPRWQMREDACTSRVFRFHCVLASVTTPLTLGAATAAFPGRKGTWPFLLKEKLWRVILSLRCPSSGSLISEFLQTA